MSFWSRCTHASIPSPSLLFMRRTVATRVRSGPMLVHTLVGLFALQHSGTHKVGFLFAPVVVIWLLSIFAIGVYNTIRWNPKVVFALSPQYIISFFSQTGKEGWFSLGGVLLAITGTEAMFADLGHFSVTSIRMAFALLVYPCLVVQYMGQAAFLSKNLSSIPNSFYDSIPDGLLWPVIIIATLAAIVGSQAIISATFSIIKQCNALGCFPRVKVVHTSKQIEGQIYIPKDFIRKEKSMKFVKDGLNLLMISLVDEELWCESWIEGC